MSSQSALVSRLYRLVLPSYRPPTRGGSRSSLVAMRCFASGAGHGGGRPGDGNNNAVGRSHRPHGGELNSHLVGAVQADPSLKATSFKLWL